MLEVGTCEGMLFAVMFELMKNVSIVLRIGLGWIPLLLSLDLTLVCWFFCCFFCWIAADFWLSRSKPDTNPRCVPGLEYKFIICSCSFYKPPRAVIDLLTAFGLFLWGMLVLTFCLWLISGHSSSMFLQLVYRLLELSLSFRPFKNFSPLASGLDTLLAPFWLIMGL